MQVSHQKVYKQGKNLYCKMWWTKRTRAVGITASNKKAPPHSRHELPNHRLTWKRQLPPRLSNVPAEHQAAGTRTHRAAATEQARAQRARRRPEGLATVLRKQHLCPEARGPLESRGKGEVLCHCCGAGHGLTRAVTMGTRGVTQAWREPAGGGRRRGGAETAPGLR